MTKRCDMTARYLALAGLVLVLSVVWPRAGRAEMEVGGPLRFALISPQSRQDIEAMWKPVLDALGRTLGRAVEADIASDYAGAIWGLRSGRDQMAWLGNKSAIEAVDNAGAEVFAQQTYPSGLGGYYTYLLVPKASPLGNVDEMIARAGELTLGRGDSNSTSGFLVPNYYLFFLRHTEPRKIFKRVIQANHADNILAVAKGRIDVATIASQVYDQVALTHPEVIAATRIIWRSPLIPGDPLVRRMDLPPNLKVRIARFFLDYGVAVPGKTAAVLAEERTALDRLNIRSFIASDNRQLEAMRRIERAKMRAKIEMDMSASPVAESARSSPLTAD